MRILIVTPAPAGSRTGNQVTAQRWADHLRALNHQVEVDRQYRAQACDLLIALHARHSADSIERFRAAHPELPIVVILTGTDLYSDLPDDPKAARSVELATLLVVLNPLGSRRLLPHLRSRVRVVVQSVALPELDPVAADGFQICVVGHLRPVKDPFLAAEAVRSLPPESAVRLVHVGRALDERMRSLAEKEQRENARYTWRGEIPQREVFQILASSKLHILTSKMEGGANALCEAIAVGVPTLATRVDGSLGILGEGYPGLFPVGDSRALGQLLEKVEGDPSFHDALRRHCVSLQPSVEPSAERAAIGRIIDELGRFTLIVAGSQDSARTFAEDVAAGLRASPKQLHCRYFYDARGSQLFEDICQLPEYYVTRAETEILTERAGEIAESMRQRLLLFELGSGSGAKTRLLLDALTAPGRQLTYVPVDISRSMLEESAFSLMAAYPDLTIVTMASEYQDSLRGLEEQPEQQKLVLWLGSNVGNFDRPGAVAFLSQVRRRMSVADRLLLGVDLRKDRATLEAAYDDAGGVTAEFNKNLLVRINRELEGDFELSNFEHEAVYDQEAGRVAMHLVCRRACSVRIKALELQVDFVAGEKIHTEDSYKYSPDEIATLARSSGFSMERHWTDGAERFYLGLLAPRSR